MKKAGIICLLVAMCVTINYEVVNAQTVSKEKTIGKYSYHATLSIAEKPLAKKPIYSSQAAHKKGTKTTIGIEEAKTTSTSASVDVTAGFNFIDSLEVKVGLTQSCSYTVSSSVTYSLKKEKSGKYRIEVWYPGRVETLKLKSKLKGSIKYNKTIIKTSKYTPIKNGQYKKLVRYAGL